ncbi:MAG: nitrate reductase associated protein [Gloeomargaritaceae cyanobacterium C42_A2020_066]|nr:nitrate reductase associated protein [Gloeomargaritaceae cyanobacterium C42_A2020_066]
MTLFQFEADFGETLHCIPLAVRFKLDTCGLKLKLSQWQRLSLEQRQQLRSISCASDGEVATFRQTLLDWVQATSGEVVADLPLDPHPPWQSGHWPAGLVEEAARQGIVLTPTQWSGLTLLQRYALVKLGRPSHEHRNFVLALREFGLVTES